MPAILRIAFALLAILILGAPSRAEMTEAEKAEIGEVVREYLLANPELLDEVIAVLRQRQQEKAESEQAGKIAQSSALIFDSTHQAVVGNPAGAVTLVEFFDYNCGYCKRALSDMNALLEANPDLRIVLKEFPILSEGSMTAARISVAVKALAPGKYLEFHRELMSRPGEASAVKALEVARDLGLDTAVLETAAAGPDVTANLEEVQQIAGLLGISGTPSYVIGTELIPGAIGYDGLQQRVSAMRECGATVC